MNQEVRSILTFNGYVVNQVEFYKNDQCTEDDSFDVKLDIQRNIERKPKENKGYVTIKTKIFEDAVKHNYPFSMNIVITGEFEVESDDEDQVRKLLEINAMAILFPYIRALITTYTANANIEPLILPPINILKLTNNHIEKS